MTKKSASALQADLNAELKVPHNSCEFMYVEKHTREVSKESNKK